MKKICSILAVLLVSVWIYAQSAHKNSFRIMCYNVENYFDCEDDTTKHDEEYLPGGLRAWNLQKYQHKQACIGKVIVAVGGWEPPAIVGLCEVESEKALRDLTCYSGLKSMKYKFVHHESPDARGVDVALLYDPAQFKHLNDRAIAINNPEYPGSTTRDILYTSGKTPSGDTLHVFVCHFPSRLGGELESESKRVFVASVLRSAVDSIFQINQGANIVIMGDFNDYPDNKSMLTVLRAWPPDKKIENGQLYNLMYPLHKSGKGSHKHAGEWGTLDQIIVSGALLDFNNSMATRQTSVQIFEAPFLLEEDKTYLGKQPKRTYIGMTYQGGFSDHLPVFLDIFY